MVVKTLLRKLLKDNFLNYYKLLYLKKFLDISQKILKRL